MKIILFCYNFPAHLQLRKVNLSLYPAVNTAFCCFESWIQQFKEKVVKYRHSDPSTWLCDNRPDFGPNQVRSRSEIHKEESYQIVDREGVHLIKVVQAPFQEKAPIMGQVWSIRYQRNGSNVIEHDYLCDLGVDQYWNRKWHVKNHILRIPKDSA